MHPLNDQSSVHTTFSILTAMLQSALLPTLELRKTDVPRQSIAVATKLDLELESLLVYI